MLPWIAIHTPFAFVKQDLAASPQVAAAGALCSSYTRERGLKRLEECQCPSCRRPISFQKQSSILRRPQGSLIDLYNWLVTRHPGLVRPICTQGARTHRICGMAASASAGHTLAGANTCDGHQHDSQVPFASIRPIAK